MSPERDRERYQEMKHALKESLAEYKIYKPHRAQLSQKDVLFFNPPYEARNPELVVH